MLEFKTKLIKSFKQNLKFYFLIALVAVCGFVWRAVAAETRVGLKVAFLDVGQGDAIFIEAPNGNQILIDGGPNKKVLGELGKIMPFYDRSIDMVIESHPDADHVNGLVDVLNKYDVGALVESGVNSDQPAYQTIEKIVNEKKIPKILARKGMKINLGQIVASVDGFGVDAGGEGDENAALEIIFPDRDPSGWDTNNASIIARLTYGKISFLFTGDSPKAIEEYVASVEKENLKSDVLKIGHHGSRTSDSEIFTGWVNPQYAVISVGANNSYGHPHQETLDTFSKFDVEVLRTDQKGAIVFEGDGENLNVESRR